MTVVLALSGYCLKLFILQMNSYKIFVLEKLLHCHNIITEPSCLITVENVLNIQYNTSFIHLGKLEVKKWIGFLWENGESVEQKTVFINFT